MQAFISQAVIYCHFHSTDSPQTTNNARMLLYTESIVQSIWQAAISTKKGTKTLYYAIAGYAYIVPVEKHTTKSKILLLTNQVQNSWHITKIFCLTPNRPMSFHATECMHTQRCLTGIFQFHSHHQHNISTWQGVN